MFPDTIFVQNRRYTRTDDAMTGCVRLYKGPENRMVCKYVQLNNGEIFFHNRVCTSSARSRHLVVVPVRILYGHDYAILVFPFMGLDAAVLSQSDFWAQDAHVTLHAMEELIAGLHVFHTQFQMAMGDIKPDNILYNTTSGSVWYIDLEYATGPYVVASEALKPTLSINIPNARTRHYRTVTTPAYESFEKRCGVEYCVFRNDRYALATTLFCLLTNMPSPGSCMTTRSLDATRDKPEWNRLHELAFKELVFHVHTILQWDKVQLSTVLNFIQVHWLNLRLPPLTA